MRIESKHIYLYYYPSPLLMFNLSAWRKCETCMCCEGGSFLFNRLVHWRIMGTCNDCTMIVHQKDRNEEKKEVS